MGQVREPVEIGPLDLLLGNHGVNGIFLLLLTITTLQHKVQCPDLLRKSSCRAKLVSVVALDPAGDVGPMLLLLLEYVYMKSDQHARYEEER